VAFSDASQHGVLQKVGSAAGNNVFVAYVHFYLQTFAIL